MTRLSGRRYRPLHLGGTGVLSAMIGIARRVAPGEDGAVFPPWQGMQYLRDMMSGEGKLSPLDNNRYPGVGWTKVEEILAATYA